jgi:hypothetical protein
VALLLRDCGVAVDAELHPAAGDDAEETGVVVVLHLNQIIETIGAVGGPVAMGFDEEAACGGFEFHAEDFGRLVVPEGQDKKEAEQVSHVVQSTFASLRAVRSSTRSFLFFSPGSFGAKDTIEKKRVNYSLRILLTIVSVPDYCGDGHSCPWRLDLCVK